MEIFAHRGASGHALENTWPAFKQASELRVGIELDIQLTADGIAIVYHDLQLKRLTGIKANICDLTYEELKHVAVRRRFKRFGSQSIPLAYEVFYWAKQKNIPLNIELKSSISAHPKGPEIVAALVEGLKNFHLSSFDIELLEQMKRMLPAAETAWIIKRGSQWQQLKDYGWIDGVHFHKKFYKPKWLDPVAKMDKKIRLYGISGNEQFLRALHPSVNGLITNYPGRLIAD